MKLKYSFLSLFILLSVSVKAAWTDVTDFYFAMQLLKKQTIPVSSSGMDISSFPTVHHSGCLQDTIGFL